jgi:decaprenylphospho-beta-D-erythro-pentofuranosid-2-ulose 2-reductase
MQNGLKEPQTIVLLGGTSEIGRAIATALLSPSARTLVLACRNTEAAHPEEFVDSEHGAGLNVVVERFDATEPSTHQAFVDRIAAEHGDIDVAIVAFAQMDDQSVYDADPAKAYDLIAVNTAGGVSVSLALAAQMRKQGHGSIAIVSSVAAERTRAANYVYGSSKTGLDAFGLGLGDALAPTGVKVTVIRPGFVHTKLTRGKKASPFSSVPREVGEQSAAAIRDGRVSVYTPGILRYVFSVLRHLPRFVWRRLPLSD